MSAPGGGDHPAEAPQGRRPDAREGPAAPSDGAQGAWAAQEPSAPAPSAPHPGAEQPAAVSMSPEELRAKLGGLGLVNPLPSLAAGGAAYLGAFLVAVLGMVLAVVAVGLSGVGDPLDAGLDAVELSPSEQISGLAGALRSPFQLVAMATFGGLGVRMSSEGMSAHAVVRVLPGVITLALVLLAFFGGRFVQKRQRAGRLGIWTSSLATGIVVALFTVLSALILAQPIPIEAGITPRLHAAGFDSFFGALVLVTVALALGRISVRARPSWWPLVSDLTAGFKLAVSHALLLSVLGMIAATVITTIQALIDGRMPPMFALILLLPLLGGHVLALFTGLPMLSAASASVTSPEILGYLLGDTQGTVRASIFSLPWYVWLIGLLLGLVALVVSSLLWQHQRRVVPHNVVALAVSWIALPLAYFVGGLVLLVLAHSAVAVQVSGGFLGGGQKMSASVGLAAWTPALALLAGAIVELLSRVLAPLITPFLPAAALRWFRRPLAPAAGGTVAAAAAAGPLAPPAIDPAVDAAPWTGSEVPGPEVLSSVEASSATAPSAAASDPAGVGYATVPLGATAGAFTGPSVQDTAVEGGVAPRAPLSRRARRALIGGGIGVGAVLVLAIGLTVAYHVVAGTRFAPEKQVEAYLDALEEGDVETAVDLAPPNVPTAEQALLTDAVAGSAEDRIDGHRIRDVEESGDTVIVTAEVTQDGVTQEQYFTLSRDGRTAVVFPNWRLGTVEYPSMAVYVPEGATALIVNGQEVPVEGLAVEGEAAVLTVVPGTYEVTLPETSEFIAPVSSSLFVPADPEGWYELLATPYYELNEAGVAEIQSQVNAQIDECADTTEESPEGCELDAWAYGIIEDSGSWEITKYPTVQVEPGEGGWYVGTDYPTGYGEATFSYQAESWGDEEPTDETDEASFGFSGVAVLEDDGTLVVTSE